MKKTNLSSKSGDLQHLPLDRINRNPDNPRLVFRPDELQDLAVSIQEIGVQVPISVYRDGATYTIIDGERRWRACAMVNLRTIPAIIYPKPTPLQNLVFMFNIHRFRVDWDPLPAAMKLDELRKLWTEGEGVEPTEAQLAALTGMSRGTVRRCRIILEIPQRYRTEILKELDKPERDRVLTTDLVIETQRSVRTLRTYLPELEPTEEPLLDALITKYKKGVIVNVTHMRLVAKIARAASKGVRRRTVSQLLNRLVTESRLGPEEAYQEVAWVYDARAIEVKVQSLSAFLESLGELKGSLDRETRSALRTLRNQIDDLLGNG